MLAQEVLELRVGAVAPCQALGFYLRTELRDLKQLRRLIGSLRRLARCAAEVEEQPRLARLPPGAQRVVEFLFSAGSGHAGRRAEPAPHDPDEEVVLPDLIQDQLLGAPHVRAGVGFPADHLEHEPCLRRDAAVELVGDGLNVVALGRDVAGRCDKDAQSFHQRRIGGRFHRPMLSPPTAVWASLVPGRPRHGPAVTYD